LFIGAPVFAFVVEYNVAAAGAEAEDTVEPNNRFFA
jgi:hypothetical protein